MHPAAIMFQLAAIETQHIIIGVLVLIIAGIAGYYLIRVMKGKIELELPKNGFNSGEEISGRVTLSAKKPLELKRMYVALVGYEITQRVDKDGDRKTRKNEVYRNEVNILDSQTVPGGVRQTFEFSMNAPGGSSNPVAGEVASRVAGAAGAVGAALGALGVSSTTRRMEWKIEARADLPGVDIAKSERVRVNLI